MAEKPKTELEQISEVKEIHAAAAQNVKTAIPGVENVINRFLKIFRRVKNGEIVDEGKK